MNRKNVIFFILSITAVMILISILMFLYKQNKIDTISCESTFSRNFISRKDDIFHGKIELDISDDIGIIHFYGEIKNTTEKTSSYIMRDITFTPKNENQSILSMANIKVYKWPIDNTDEGLFKSVSFFDFDSRDGGVKSAMKIYKLDNAYIVGTRHSPLFVCVEK